jgi:hypothetical protein
MDISNYLNAGSPALYIATKEPLRATNAFSIASWHTWLMLR